MFVFLLSCSLEEEWEDQNRERLMNTVLLANQLVREANMLSEALHRDTMFRVTLTVSDTISVVTHKYIIDILHPTRCMDIHEAAEAI